MLIYQLLNDPIQFILTLPCILIALTFHEWAHGYAAYKCGDNTARIHGRLSLNPLAHLDIFGSIMMLLVGFGWAKPVPVITRNFKHPKRDFAIVAVAGPLMNLLLAFGSLMLATLISYISGCEFKLTDMGISVSISQELSQFASNFIFYSIVFFSMMAMLNIGLAVFNLIPIPPLDGSRVVSWLLPPMLSAKYNRIELYTRYILLGFIILQYIPLLSFIPYYLLYPVYWLREIIVGGFSEFWNMVFGLIWSL